MKKLIIAHRGASSLAQENTLEAFQKAIELGADMIELDIRKTRDGMLVVYHDAGLRGQKISQLDFGTLKNLNPRIPSFAETLELVAGKIKLDIEIKERGLEQDLLNLVLKKLPFTEFVVTSFYVSVISKIKRLNPQVQVGLIVDSWGGAFANIVRNFEWQALVEHVLASFGIVKEIDFLAPHWSLCSQQFTKAVQVRGKPIFVWTVDDERQLRSFLQDKNISGIITNRPELAIKLRRDING